MFILGVSEIVQSHCLFFFRSQAIKMARKPGKKQQEIEQDALTKVDYGVKGKKEKRTFGAAEYEFEINS